MEYDLIEEAGRLRVKYDGPPLDALSLGILNSELHGMVEKVAVATLLSDPTSRKLVRREYKLYKSEFSANVRSRLSVKELATARPYEDIKIVELRIEKLEFGSLTQEFSLYAASFLASDDVRDVLRSVFADVLFSILATGFAMVKGIVTTKKKSSAGHPIKGVDVGPNICKIVDGVTKKGYEVKVSLSGKDRTSAYKVEIDVKRKEKRRVKRRRKRS